MADEKNKPEPVAAVSDIPVGYVRIKAIVPKDRPWSGPHFDLNDGLGMRAMTHGETGIVPAEGAKLAEAGDLCFILEG